MSQEGFEIIDYESLAAPRVGIGLLGCGFIGQVHSNAYLKIPFTYQSLSVWTDLIALCDKVAAKEKATRFRYKGFYTDWQQMIKDPRIDIIDNCTPDNVHCEPSIAAAENGKHIVCEKPLAMTVEQARRMRDAVKKAGVKNMCCHNYRFIPAIRLAWEIISAGKLGKVYHFRGRYLQEVGHDPAQTLENVWYASGTRSGVLLGIGSHVIDIARFLVGEIKAVSGLLHTPNTSRKAKSGKTEQVITDEENAAIVEFENGAIGTIESSGIAAGRKNQLTWEINAEKGSMVFDLEDPNHLQVYDAEGSINEAVGFADVLVTEPNHPLRVNMLPPGHNQGWEYGHLHALGHFVNCVVNDKPVEPHAASFEDGYRVQVIMEAIKESWRTQKRIEVRY